MRSGGMGGGRRAEGGDVTLAECGPRRESGCWCTTYGAVICEVAKVQRYSN